jgi:hypothetical protein
MPTQRVVASLISPRNPVDRFTGQLITNMVRKLFAVASLVLSIAIVMTASCQSLVPTDSATVQMGTNTPPPPPPGHLQIQYNVNPQGVNQSWNTRIRFDLSELYV